MGQRCPRILLVEDHPAVAITVKDGIEYFSPAEVIWAENGIRARSILTTQTIDLALIDILLPDIIGFEIAREAAFEHHVPVLLISGSFDHQQIADLCGFPCAHKPLHPSKLVKHAMATIAEAEANIRAVKKSYGKLLVTRETIIAAPWAR